MIKKYSKKNSHAVSLVEVMPIMAILSILILPLLILVTEYNRGDFSLKENYEVLASVEEKIETVLAMSFSDLIEGERQNVIIESKNGIKLDLRPVFINNKIVNFKCIVETFPVAFSPIKSNATNNNYKRINLENGMKKVTIIANWGKKDRMKTIELICYKSNLNN